LLQTIGKCDFCGNTFKKPHVFTSAPSRINHSAEERFIEVNGNRLHLDVAIVFNIFIPEFSFDKSGSQRFDTCEPCLDKLKNAIDKYLPKMEEIVKEIIEETKGNVPDDTLTKFDILDIDVNKLRIGFAHREDQLTTYDDIPF